MTTNPRDLINFFTKVGQLKKIKRTGWVLRGVPEPESIADHSFRLAVMVWLLGRNRKLDMLRVIKMALVHDLCEVYAGDMTPHDEQVKQGLHKGNMEIFDHWPRRVRKEEKEKWVETKHIKERGALDKLLAGLSSDLRGELRALWLEYEEGATPEGRFVRQLDRVENALQASEYRREDESLHIGSFWVQIKEWVDDPGLIEFLEEIDQYYNVPLDSSK